ncbi:MAG: TolC family protein, partial [Muribaculaceae bacterium]|nr:TolC family protein [Muribaculaceae bacterium]
DWEYRTYKADLLPEVNFAAKLPGYYKQYSPYQLDDGSYTFVRSNYMQMNGELSIAQNIWLTGGTLSLTSSADFVRQLDGNRYSRFMSVPVALTLNQPLFGVNTVRWNRRIEPVRYREAQARFLSATETVAMTAIQYFFNLLMARENVNVARQNLANADKLYEVARAKRDMGKISKNDLMQLELNRLNAQSTLTDAESTLKSNMFRLRSFLDLCEDDVLEPVVPERVPQCDVVYADVLDKALANNQFSYNLRRRQLEADYEVAKAKGNLRQINVYASVGYTGTDGRFDNAYRHLKDNQVVEVGVKIPLVDWGKRRGQVKVARSNRQVVESKLRQEAMNFNQDLFILVERFNNQQQQVALAAKADTIAGKRYDTNVQTFMIGRISTLDLNDSQTRKDEQRQQYINELYLFWYYYYQLRSLTLWNYIENRSIDADFDSIAKQ